MEDSSVGRMMSVLTAPTKTFKSIAERPTAWLAVVLLVVLTAIAIVVSLQAVGVALMIAMLVTPAATAYMLTNRLPVMMVLAAALASFAGVAGLYISFYAGVSSGAAIVLTSTALFAITWALQALQRAGQGRQFRRERLNNGRTD